jgi:pimeloyl-ACP methyl ester carboxylesterase
LGLLGVSRGASAALAAAARTPAVQCVVSDGAFSVSTLLVDFARRWGQLYLPAAMLRCVPLWHVRLTIQLMKWISQARRGCVYSNLERGLRRLQSKPVLMISGESDNYVSPEITRGLQRLTRQDAGGGAWIAPKARHNLARQVNSETYDRLLVAFFSQMQMPTPTARALAGGDSPVAVKRGEQAISA